MSAARALTLMRVSPFLANNYDDVRQWTIRENLNHIRNGQYTASIDLDFTSSFG
jgi:hypothetical protein